MRVILTSSIAYRRCGIVGYVLEFFEFGIGEHIMCRVFFSVSFKKLNNVGFCEIFADLLVNVEHVTCRATTKSFQWYFEKKQTAEKKIDEKVVAFR